MIPIWRWFLNRSIKVPLWGLFFVGTLIGFLTGIVSNIGPINTQFFLAHGLMKGPFIGTEANELVVHVLVQSSGVPVFGRAA